MKYLIASAAHSHPDPDGAECRAVRGCEGEEHDTLSGRQRDRRPGVREALALSVVMARRRAEPQAASSYCQTSSRFRRMRTAGRSSRRLGSQRSWRRETRGVGALHARRRPARSRGASWSCSASPRAITRRGRRTRTPSGRSGRLSPSGWRLAFSSMWLGTIAYPFCFSLVVLYQRYSAVLPVHNGRPLC